MDDSTAIGVFVMGIIFGLKGNRWREANLLSRGFEYKDDVTAANSESAIAYFLKDSSKSLHS